MQGSGTVCREDDGLRPYRCLTIESDVTVVPNPVSSLPGLTRLRGRSRFGAAKARQSIERSASLEDGCAGQARA
jgi:hypothetical protein